ncbi:MAG TPA: hypothetical protein VFA63_04510 [Pseudonocardiaceae bacterium]|nr:hypothetical protein [Pseudonocardiaceae bacterium]
MTERSRIIPGRLLSMNQERNQAPHHDSAPAVSSQDESPIGAMRGGFDGWTRWSEDEHTKTDIRECTDQHCMNVEVNCGFQGLIPDSPLSQSAAVSDELRAAWRAKLASEGKSTSGAQSLRDIIFGGSR